MSRGLITLCPIMRKPYFYRSRGIWVVDTNNGRVNLGSDETKAHEAWAAMLAVDQRPARAAKRIKP